MGSNNGVYCGDSGENVFHHNSFVENKDQAYFSGYGCESNIWHDPLSNEGNFWSDYRGFDTDGDGARAE